MDAAGLNLEGEEGNVEEGVELCQPEAVLHARVQDVHGATPAQSEPQNGLEPAPGELSPHSFDGTETPDNFQGR